MLIYGLQYCSITNAQLQSRWLERNTANIRVSAANSYEIYAPVHANTNSNDSKSGASLSSSRITADCVAVSGQDTRSVTSTHGGAKALVTP